MRIFLVDDEKEIADLIELYLKNDGFDVIKCSDGKTALEKPNSFATAFGAFPISLHNVKNLFQNFITLFLS